MRIDDLPDHPYWPAERWGSLLPHGDPTAYIGSYRADTADPVGDVTVERIRWVAASGAAYVETSLRFAALVRLSDGSWAASSATCAPTASSTGMPQAPVCWWVSDDLDGAIANLDDAAVRLLGLELA